MPTVNMFMPRLTIVGWALYFISKSKITLKVNKKHPKICEYTFYRHLLYTGVSIREA